MEKPLRAAVCGLGGIGQVFLSAIDRHPDWELVAAIDRNASAIGEVGGADPTLMIGTDLAELFESSRLSEVRPDLLVIATPPATHCELAVAALGAGLNVLCEKPLALGPEQAARMVEAAKQRPDRLTLLNHQMRFSAAFRWVKSSLDAGRIGRVRHVSVYAAYPHWLDREWDWWSSAELGGGVLNEAGSHVIDLLQWMFGPVADAQGTLRTVTHTRRQGKDERPVTSDEIAAFQLEFESGAFADVTLSCLARPRNVLWRIVGDEGTIAVDDRSKGSIDFASGNRESVDLSEQGPPLTPDPYDNYSLPLLASMGQIAAALTSGIDLVDASSFFDGQRTLDVIDSIRRSAGGSGG